MAASRTLYEFADYVLSRYETILRVLDSEMDNSAEAVSEIDREMAALRSELEAHRTEDAQR